MKVEVDKTLGQHEYTDLPRQTIPNDYVTSATIPTPQHERTGGEENEYAEIDLSFNSDPSANSNHKAQFSNALYDILEKNKATGNYEKLAEDDA